MKRSRGFEFIREYRECGLKLPVRSTHNSAGYDIAAVQNVCLKPGKMVVIPTGIKAYMLPDEYLAIHIRSSLGVKHGLYLLNGQGIIDSDYYDNPDNEGHIMIAMGNRGTSDFVIDIGMRIAQGIFGKYLLTDQDQFAKKESRGGGIGSTGS